MKLIEPLFVATLVLGSTSSNAKEYGREALLGVWACGPCTMKGEGFEVAVTDTSSYLDDGTYKSTSELTVRMHSGKVVKTRDQVVGSWTFDGRIIEIYYEKAEFLW